MSLFNDLNQPSSFVYKDNVFIVNNKYVPLETKHEKIEQLFKKLNLVD